MGYKAIVGQQPPIPPVEQCAWCIPGPQGPAGPQGIPGESGQIPDELKVATLAVEKEAQFNNVIKVGDYEGQTVEIKTEGGVMVFKNGILIKYER
jgi:hypothetical protein